MRLKQISGDAVTAVASCDSFLKEPCSSQKRDNVECSPDNQLFGSPPPSWYYDGSFHAQQPGIWDAKKDRRIKRYSSLMQVDTKFLRSNAGVFNVRMILRR